MGGLPTSSIARPPRIHTAVLHGLLALVATLAALCLAACAGAAPTPTSPPAPTRTAIPAATTTATAVVARPTITSPALPAGAATAPAVDLFILKANRGQVALHPVEVADTVDLRTVGLSGRTTLSENAGMLFVFPDNVTTGFWMRNTHVPLSIAFIGADGRILDIQDMQPLSERIHAPGQPYRFALEVNQGFYTRNGVAKGDRVQVSERLRSRAPGL